MPRDILRPQKRIGTSAQRLALDPTNYANEDFFEVDTTRGYRSDGITWVQISSLAGAQLAIAEATSWVNGNTGTGAAVGTAPADWTGLSITFAAGSRPILLHAQCAAILQNTTAGNPNFIIADPSNVVYSQVLAGQEAAATYAGAVNAFREVTLTPGVSYTFKVRVVASASTCTPVANATSQRAFIRATEC